MEGPPAVMFVVDSHRETIAVREAQRLGITCIAIVDTNSDPDEVMIPIPGNDDAIRAINLFCGIIADAVIEGRATFEKKRAEEEATVSEGASVVAGPMAKAGDGDGAAAQGAAESEAPEVDKSAETGASENGAPAVPESAEA